MEYRTAVHEAGHAVLALVQGVEFNTVTIIPDEDSLGRKLSPPLLEYSGRDRRWAARRSIIATYGGAEAERAVLGDVWMPGIGGDEENAFWISQEFQVLPRRCQFIGDDLHREYLERLRREARKLARLWQGKIVEAANLLIQRKTLTCVELERLIGLPRDRRPDGGSAR